jgi:hypothetical protein
MTRFEQGGSRAFVHDVTTGPLPAEYEDCDLLYAELPWLSEFGTGRAEKYEDFMTAVRNILLAAFARSVPVVLPAGLHARHFLPEPTELYAQTSVQGRTQAVFVFGDVAVDPRNASSLLLGLAHRFQHVGDFCCGWGRAGKAFYRAGRRFTLSDVKAECIQHISNMVESGSWLT